MGLKEEVSAAFSEEGCLASSVTEFRPREGQIRMAEAVAQTIANGGSLVVEAGTGIGKTYAYLVPALLSGGRVLVSTATKALQDQLYLHDIPRLTKAFALPLRTAVLKGRSSYLCLHRMHCASDGEWPAVAGLNANIRRIVAWSQQTHTGDLTEVLDADEATPVLPLVSSTRDNCLGAGCSHFMRCHVNLARKRAKEADLVVINHHLFFADLNIRESGVAELLPEVRTVVFDEAHQLNDIGVQFLGTELSTYQLLVLCKDLSIRGPELALAMPQGLDLLLGIETAVSELHQVVGKHAAQKRLRWIDTAPQGVDANAWTVALQSIETRMAAALCAIAQVAPSSVESMALYERTLHLHALMALFLAPLKPGFVRWLEVGQQLRFFQSPMDIAQDMQARVLKNAGVQHLEARSWIFTSATLGHDSQLRWFVDSCGLQGCEVLQVGSPFDHAVQSALYIPEDFPKPSDPAHASHVAALVADAASVLGGKTMVLTTTLRAMHALGHALAKHFSGHTDIEVLVQGSQPKQELLQKFATARDATRGCLLIGSATFWEGIDLPGDVLQLLVIDKLPFAPPGDPLLDARAQRSTEAGKSAFKEVHLPIAAVALKQGAGRLIRRESDRGVLVVCDVRMREMGYGRQLIAALPPMRQVATDEAFVEELNALTKLSTRDQHRP